MDIFERKKVHWEKESREFEKRKSIIITSKHRNKIFNKIKYSRKVINRISLYVWIINLIYQSDFQSVWLFVLEKSFAFRGILFQLSRSWIRASFYFYFNTANSTRNYLMQYIDYRSQWCLTAHRQIEHRT